MLNSGDTKREFDVGLGIRSFSRLANGNRRRSSFAKAPSTSSAFLSTPTAAPCSQTIYSSRNAMTGSTAAARRAGINDAAATTIKISMVTPA